MIHSLRGTLRNKGPSSAIIECQGVGYGVEMALPALAALGDIDSVVSCHVYTHVAEDQLRLFGFVSQREREAFIVLLSTAGVGPRLALTILTALDADALAAAVMRRDRAALVQIPGIGAKKAERLLVELQGRFDSLAESAIASHGAPARAAGPQGEVEGALLHLGFAAPDAARAAQQALQSADAPHDVAALVRHALRGLTNKPGAARGRKDVS